MLRIAVRPRFLGLLALAMLLAMGFSLMANWQWSRAHNPDRREAGPASVQLIDVAKPQSTLSGDVLTHPVTVSGRFQGERALTVINREQDGVRGSWSLVPLAVTLADGSTATLPVVRGFVPEDATAPQVPGGVVHLRGWMQGGQAPSDAPGPGTLRTVSLADLAARWGPPIYSGYLLAQEQTGEDTASVPADGMRPVPAPEKGGLNLQNVSYALQWVAFAGFAFYMWWRMVRDAYRRENLPPQSETPQPDKVEEPTK